MSASEILMFIIVAFACITCGLGVSSYLTLARG